MYHVEVYCIVDARWGGLWGEGSYNYQTAFNALDDYLFELEKKGIKYDSSRYRIRYREDKFARQYKDWEIDHEQ